MAVRDHLQAGWPASTPLPPTLQRGRCCHVDDHGIVWWALDGAATTASTTVNPPTPSLLGLVQEEPPAQPPLPDLDGGLVDPHLAADLWDARAHFETVAWSRYCRAREVCNKYEALSRKDSPNPFVSRSALKLANINFLLQGSLCRPLPGRAEVTFVDLCGGPGGFSECILATCESQGIKAQGWGMTLVEGRDHCSWEMGALASWTVKEATEVDQGQRLELCYGADGSGDLCQLENINDLVSRVMAGNHGERVGLVVADGGFAGARSRFDQEDVMLPLLYSEVLAAYKLLLPDGTFICKFFDLTLPATASLLHDLASSFHRMAIIKPITSRPASSERYVVCTGFRVSVGQAVARMERCHRLAVRGSTSSLQCPAEPPTFLAYLRFSNDLLMRHQLDACYAIIAQLQAWEEEEEEEGVGQEVEGVDTPQVGIESHDCQGSPSRKGKRIRLDPEASQGLHQEAYRDDQGSINLLVAKYYQLWGCCTDHDKNTSKV